VEAARHSGATGGVSVKVTTARRVWFFGLGEPGLASRPGELRAGGYIEGV